MDDYEWYHGPCSRNEAEYHLSRKPQGTFLIRESESVPGNHSLSVMHEGNPVHVPWAAIKRNYERLSDWTEGACRGCEQEDCCHKWPGLREIDPAAIVVLQLPIGVGGGLRGGCVHGVRRRRGRQRRGAGPFSSRAGFS